MAHPTRRLHVANCQVLLVEVNRRLYVPMRHFVEQTLDMNWAGQKSRLIALSTRWKMAYLEVSGKRGKAVVQPCLRVGLMPAYLWSLRPTSAEKRLVLERLRDSWDDALLAYLRFVDHELENTGSFLVQEVERAMLPLRDENERLKAEANQLREQLARAAPVINVLNRPVDARRYDAVTDADLFMEMARLNNAGVNNADIAKQLNKSRTTVSLFLDGKYQSGQAKVAWTRLQASGWKKLPSEQPKDACLIYRNAPTTMSLGQGIPEPH